MKDFDFVGILNFISLSLVFDFMASVFDVEFFRGVLIIIVQFSLTLLVRYIMDKLNKKTKDNV